MKNKLVLVGLIMLLVVVSGCSSDISKVKFVAKQFCQDKGFDNYKWESETSNNANFFCINESNMVDIEDYYLGEYKRW